VACLWQETAAEQLIVSAHHQKSLCSHHQIEGDSYLHHQQAIDNVISSSIKIYAAFKNTK